MDNKCNKYKKIDKHEKIFAYVYIKKDTCFWISESFRKYNITFSESSTCPNFFFFLKPQKLIHAKITQNIGFYDTNSLKIFICVTETILSKLTK